MDVVLMVLWALLGVVGLGTVAVLVYLAWPLAHPFLTESDYSHHSSPWWQLCYGHKYLRPAKNPVRGSGLKEHFARQDFNFDDAPLTDSKEITIGCTGDLMVRKDLLGRGGAHLWDDVGESLFGADLSIGNLEFAVNPNWVIEKILRFSVPYDRAEILLGSAEHGRFDVVSLANNHINDSLKEGIKSTCDFLDKEGILHAGVSRSSDEQKQVTYANVQGLKIAILSYTFTTNNVPLDEGHEFGVNLIRFNALRDEDYDPSLIHEHIKTAKKEGADFIIACNHWANDLEFYPPPHVVSRAHDLLDAGVDMIVGHHSHVPGKLERYQTKDGRDTIVCYSLGNFTTAGLIFPILRIGQLMHVTLETGLDAGGSKVIRPKHVALTPIYHSMNKGEQGEVKHRVLPMIPSLNAIEKGNIPSHFSHVDAKNIKKLVGIYRENFTAAGIEYR